MKTQGTAPAVEVLMAAQRNEQQAPERTPEEIRNMATLDSADMPPLRGFGGGAPPGTLFVLSAVGPTPGGGCRMSAVIPKPGDRIGGDDGRRFEILERLGTGGMAVVLLAKDTVLDRTVAIKFITHEILGAGGNEAVERFKLEARASARLSHENIVRVFDLGTANGVPFLVMEHLEGRPLDVVAAHEEVDALRAVRILADVARGLSHAHRSGIVHRDLKPSNVFLLEDGRAKIVDFGLASVAVGIDARGAQSHALAGTPRYMSPEQWRGGAQDGRTDIWAAGVMLFELLARQPPFAAPRLLDVRRMVLSPDPAPSLRQLRPDLPEEAERILAATLAKDVAKRFGSADELLYALVALEVALSRSLRAATQDARASRSGSRARSRSTRPRAWSTCLERSAQRRARHALQARRRSPAHAAGRARGRGRRAP
jgi:serine/threonine protein kinase